MPAAYAARAEEVAARRKEFLLRSSRYDILEVNDEFLNYLRIEGEYAEVESWRHMKLICSP